MIALVVRTRGPFYRSRPGRLLLVSTLAVTVVAGAIPFLPGAGLLGFVPLSASLVVSLTGVVLAYVVATEFGKLWFYGRCV